MSFRADIQYKGIDINIQLSSSASVAIWGIHTTLQYLSAKCINNIHFHGIHRWCCHTSGSSIYCTSDLSLYLDIDVGHFRIFSQLCVTLWHHSPLSRGNVLYLINGHIGQRAIPSFSVWRIKNDKHERDKAADVTNGACCLLHTLRVFEVRIDWIFLACFKHELF